MTNLSMSLVNILYNYQLLRLAGENGVAAYGVIMYAAFLFVAVFVGYAVGSAPIVSFHYGARNHAEVHNLYRKSLRLIAVERSRVIAAAWSGKIKTGCTMVGLGAMMLFPTLNLVNIIFTVLILATTVYSGAEYFYVNRDVFKDID